MKHTILPYWSWRTLAIFYAAASVLLLFFDHHLGLFPAIQGGSASLLFPLPVYFVLYGLSALVLILLVIYPTQLYLYSIDCCFWSLFGLVQGGSAVGCAFFLLGVTLAEKQGFFDKHPIPKAAAAVVVLMAAIFSQARFGTKVVVTTLLDFLLLLLVILVFAIIFRPELTAIFSEHRKRTLRLAKDEFSERDAEVLTRILNGEKYKQIAPDFGLSLDYMYNRCTTLFRKLGVPDRRSFVARYGHWRMVRE
jgi:DNA-binding CsgD family transcriptional regulator